MWLSGINMDPGPRRHRYIILATLNPLGGRQQVDYDIQGLVSLIVK